MSDQEVGISLSQNDTDSTTGEPSIQILSSLLMNGQTLTVTFLDGNEGSWQASLNGSATELEQFATCIHTVKVATNPTQPFSGNPSTTPTQPVREAGIPQETNEAIRKVILPYLNMPR
jgi:hypothetical protein